MSYYGSVMRKDSCLEDIVRGLYSQKISGKAEKKMN